MAIIEETIASAIKDMQEELKTIEDQNEAITKFSETMAAIIKDAITSATISGILTAGSSTNQSQVSGTGTLS